MTAKHIEQYFNERSDSYIRLAKWATNGELLLATASMLEEVIAESVVDLGCGNGILLNYLKQFPFKIGIDLSMKMLVSNKSTDVQRILADAHQLPLTTSGIDLVICRQVLHYCQPQIVLNEVRRVLNSHGLLHIVQLTDYDNVPDEWHQFWVNLRGVTGRTRIPRRKLLEYVHDANLAVLKEESRLLFVHHTWKDFFEKNSVVLERQKEVITFFANTPSEVAKAYQLSINDEGLSYNRRFSLLLVNNRGDK